MRGVRELAPARKPGRKAVEEKWRETRTGERERDQDLERVVGEGYVGRVHEVLDEEVEGVGQVASGERRVHSKKQREDLLGQ